MTIFLAGIFYADATLTFQTGIWILGLGLQSSKIYSPGPYFPKEKNEFLVDNIYDTIKPWFVP